MNNLISKVVFVVALIAVGLLITYATHNFVENTKEDLSAYCAYKGYERYASVPEGNYCYKTLDNGTIAYAVIDDIDLSIWRNTR